MTAQRPPDPRRPHTRVGFVPVIVVASVGNLAALAVGIYGVLTKTPWTGIALGVCVVLAFVLIRFGLAESERVSPGLLTTCRLVVLLNALVLAAWLLTALTSLVGGGV